MKVNEIMTVDPVCCTTTDSAQTAASMMRKLKIGSVPVVESDKSYRIVGLVTDRDFCTKVVAEGKDPKSVQLCQCMSQNIVSCNPETELEDALNLMAEKKIHHLPVVDEEFRIVGIVSMADIALYGELSPERVDQAFREMYRGTADLSYFASKYETGTSKPMPAF
jgi:CBS domain-containing protein